jgi:hypothetical protein
METPDDLARVGNLGDLYSDLFDLEDEIDAEADAADDANDAAWLEANT